MRIVLLIFLFMTSFLNFAYGTGIKHVNKQTSNKKEIEISPYESGAKSYRRGSYSKSLKHYQNYLFGCRKSKCPTTKRLFSIDMIGSIYLRVRKDPSSLISFYKDYTKKGGFNDAVQDEIDEWVNASQEWLKNKKFPHQINKPKELLTLGDYFYLRGIKKKKYPMDRSGNADLSIAASYYVPYIYEFNNKNQVGLPLLRMGIIRSTLWTDKESWTPNFYLKEAIRRFPNSAVAKKAFKTLDEEVHYSYTGSSGDSTPPSQLEMLKYFRNIANGEFEKAKKIRVYLF
jgi:hypothetical protein